ncbi:MAG: hypothetical protein KatS3mg023_1839 [Armatimonadota bacterium]|nr:MAG: hypothetical protein KatS3mg023_1839 [Armatimonadota bacterium]
MRVARARSVYICRIERFVRMRCGLLRNPSRWWAYRMQVRDYLFLFLYGLPAEVQTEFALHIVKMYLPNFEAFNPSDTRARRVVEAVEAWLKDRDTGEQLLRRCDLQDLREPREYVRFLVGGIGNLRDLILLWRDSKLGSAAATAEIVWACVEQRMEDVWRADDPEAYNAFRKWQEVDAQFHPKDSNDPMRGEWEDLLDLWCDRGAPDNVASCAVARREWHKIVHHLWKIERIDPLADCPSRRERYLWREDLWNLQRGR